MPQTGPIFLAKAQRRLRIIGAGQCVDCVPASRQFVNEPRADKARGAGDKHGLGHTREIKERGLR